MNKSLNINLFCCALILMCGLFCVSAQTNNANNSALPLATKSPETVASQEKRRKAEQVVVRAMRIFGQNLDFNDVYRETFIKDEKVRREIGDMFMDGFFDKKFVKKLNRNVQQRAIITAQNLFWLFLFYSFHTNDESAFDKLINLVEREISTKLNKRQRITYKQLFKEGKDSTIETRSDALDRLFIFENTLIVIRKHFSLKFRQDLKNKITAEASPTQSYIPKFKQAYSVEIKIHGNQIPVEFTVVEESGVMRILSVWFVSGS